MTILLQRLVEYAWVIYVLCAIGAIIYAVRALGAHRARRLAIFTLEREAATSKVVQAWAIVLVFCFIGASVFFVVTFFLSDLPARVEGSTPEPSGLELRTPTATPTPTPTPGIEILTIPAATVAAIPTPIPPEVTDSPEAGATVLPLGAVSGEVHAQFGNPPFAELVSYGLSAAEIAAGQPLELTLNWRALDATSPIDYVIFTHLRKDDGNIIAQHDGPPAGGNRPMTTWGPGASVIDVHLMAFAEEHWGYAGSATIAVGLYNPEVPAERVLVSTGGDYVTLPVTLVVTSQQ
jgi:hypothetical protein